MSKQQQFPVIRFARGTRLTIEHVFDPLTEMKTQAGDANLLDTQEEFGVTETLWSLPWIGSAAVAPADTPNAMLTWPWPLPPFQQLFNRTTLVDPQYPVILDELCFSIDQEAEPRALVGTQGGEAPGSLSHANLSRYNMTLRLLSRTPSLLTADPATPQDATSGDLSSTTELLKIEIDGVNAFGLGVPGTSIARANPAVFANLGISLNPWLIYLWTLDCPGLFDAGVAGVKDTWVFTVSGGPVAGNKFQLVIGVNAYDFTAADAVLANIAIGIAAAAAADPAYNVTAVGATVKVEQKVAADTTTVVECLVLTGVGTTFGEHTLVGKTKVGGAQVDQLLLNSISLTATTLSPLTVRDNTDDFSGVLAPGLSNIPTVHDGGRTGLTIPLTLPTVNAPITGDDIQDGLHGFDRALRQRAPSGYGAGYGALANPMQSADVPPFELLRNDSHMTVIAVPLWSGQAQESIRVSDLGAMAGDNPMGLPYTEYPYTSAGGGRPATEDVRNIAVPEGFVLHHAFAVWNGYSPVSSQIASHDERGIWPVHAGFSQEVGIFLNSGWGTDDYKEQQVA